MKAWTHIKCLLNKSITFIRAINRSIVDDGLVQNNEDRVYFKIMNSEIFEDIQPGNDIQIFHFVSFSNDETIRDKFDENSWINDILVELVVPKECCNAWNYEELSNETSL